MNEDAIANTTFAGNAISAQPGQFAYSIFDSALLKKYKKKGPDITVARASATTCSTTSRTRSTRRSRPATSTCSRPTASRNWPRQMGIAPDTLAADGRRVQRPLRRGWDELFEKDHRYLQPISKPPFYACRYFPGAYGTLGGIKINYKAEVLDDELQPDPRPVCGRSRRLHHLRRQLSLHPARQHHGLHAEYGTHRRRERGRTVTAISWPGVAPRAALHRGADGWPQALVNSQCTSPEGCPR